MATRKDFEMYRALVRARETNALRFGIEKGLSVAKLRNPFSPQWDRPVSNYRAIKFK